MAAPAAANAIRTTPGGLKLFDGFQSVVGFANDLDIELFEKTVTPPGLDGGDPVEMTTMWNTTWRTFNPRALITLTEMSFTAAYDPTCYTSIIAIINDNQEISVMWCDGSTACFFGFLQKFEPNEVSEGEQPDASVTIVPTNVDNDGAEQAPEIVEVAGT